MKQLIKKIFIMVLVAVIAMPMDGHAATKKKSKKRTVTKSYRVTANSAILIDINNNKLLYGRDIYQQVFPASTTKVMTALLVLEKLALDDYVTVSAHATQVQPTVLGAVAGEQFKVRDLLYAILLKSANDAAVVLAEAVAGSENNFVAMMNAKAKQLGAKQTRFANPHGLPDTGRQYTTARDMVTILNAALKNDFFKAATALKYKQIYSKDGRRFFLKSHNKALFLGWKKGVYGKTGYTRQAQSCFVGYVNRGNTRLMVAVFGCRKRWNDIKFIIERYGKIPL